MAIGVNVPRNQNGNPLGSALSLAGAGIGALAGGPAGAAAGMQLGGAVGGMMNQNQASAQPVDVGGDAISRRKAQLDNSPLRQIRESIDSLKYVQDDQQRAELAKPLLQADYMARMKGQNVG